MNIKELKNLISEIGEFEKGDHRKYSEFYATMQLEVTDEVVEEYPQLEKFLGLTFTFYGMWSEDWGFDGDYGQLEAYRSEIVQVPEEIIVKPAHERKEFFPVNLIDLGLED